MPHIVSDIFKKDLLERTIDFKTDVIKVALMTNHHRYDASDAFWCNVQHNEIAGKGYKAGGQRLHSVEFKKTHKTVYLTGDNMVWSSAKFTMRSIVLYFERTGKVIGTTGFTEDKSVDNAFFTLQWCREGIIVEYYPDMPPEYLNYYFNKEHGND